MTGHTTTSLCPHCLRRLPATVETRGDDVWLARVCPDHGETRALIWGGPPDYAAWRAAGSGPGCCDPPENPACPAACGLCTGHARQTCCVLLEVTSRCDLQCPVCFAAATRGAPADPSIDEIEGWLRRLLGAAPGCNVQLSGGEPTMRDDLPQVVALSRSLGHGFVQLNTNGLRLAEEEGYAELLASAGLGAVFLQFDGLDDRVHGALRGRPLAALKERAVHRCAEAGLGVVLVPTVVRDVNLSQLGAVLEFALAHAPTVRGVHLQPQAFLGRYSGDGAASAARVTLPDAMRALAEQSGGRVLLSDLTPGDCEHALCSFSREYLRREDGSLSPLGGGGASACSCEGSGGANAGGPVVPPAEKAAHVARRWAGPEAEPAKPTSASGCCAGPASPDDQWDDILRQVTSGAFSISGMAFQDAWTIDLERLRHCYLHVLARDGRLVPFCAYNLTAADGSGLATGRLAEARRRGPAPGPA